METTTFYTLAARINNECGLLEDWYLSTRDLEDPDKETVILGPIDGSLGSGLTSLIDHYVMVTHSGGEFVGRLDSWSKSDEFSIEFDGKTI